jgi:hypothetical protein
MIGKESILVLILTLVFTSLVLLGIAFQIRLTKAQPSTGTTFYSNPDAYVGPKEFQ